MGGDPSTLTPVSKRPLGDSMIKEGGLKGYSGGSKMRPWYKPPCERGFAARSNS